MPEEVILTTQILDKVSSRSHKMAANVIELRVGLHCDECIKKILKAIKKLDNVDTYNVDIKLNKVIVTGNITSEEIIKALHKIGRTATSWDAPPYN